MDRNTQGAIARLQAIQSEIKDLADEAIWIAQALTGTPAASNKFEAYGYAEIMAATYDNTGLGRSEASLDSLIANLKTARQPYDCCPIEGPPF